MELNVIDDETVKATEARAIAQYVLWLEQELNDVREGNRQLRQMVLGWNEQAKQIVTFLGADYSGQAFAGYVIETINAKLNVGIEEVVLARCKVAYEAGVIEGKRVTNGIPVAGAKPEEGSAGNGTDEQAPVVPDRTKKRS